MAAWGVEHRRRRRIAGGTWRCSTSRRASPTARWRCTTGGQGPALDRDCGPDRCLRVAVAHPACLAATPAPLDRTRRAWAPTIDDGFCSFNDLHAMLAFVGARDWIRAQRLELALAEAASLPTRYGETTRQLGLPACRALIAFGRGNDTAGDCAAREPAGAGASTRRQPCAARRAAPDSAACHRAHARCDPSIRNGAAANRCAAPAAGPGLACRNRPSKPEAPRSTSNSGRRSRC